MSTPSTPSNQAIRLASLRSRSGLTTREVAEKIGRSAPRITEYESNPNIKIKVGVLEKLAQVYKVTPDFILYGESGAPSSVQHMSQVITQAQIAAGHAGAGSGIEKWNQAQTLKALRMKAGLSQMVVAEKATQLAGRPVTHLNIERYESDPMIKLHPDTVAALAIIYNTSVGYITIGTESVDNLLPNRQTTAEIITSLGDKDYADLPFVPFTAYGSFVSGCRERKFMDLSTFRVLKRPGVDYKDAVVIEVTGNSMAPRYPDRSCQAVRPVSDGNWQYATGVHAISLRGDGDGDAMFLIKRIRSNKEGVLLLVSDNNDQEMTVQLGDILCMWKVGECVYMSAEE